MDLLVIDFLENMFLKIVLFDFFFEETNKERKRKKKHLFCTNKPEKNKKKIHTHVRCILNLEFEYWILYLKMGDSQNNTAHTHINTSNIRKEI